VGGGGGGGGGGGHGQCHVIYLSVDAADNPNRHCHYSTLQPAISRFDSKTSELNVLGYEINMIHAALQSRRTRI
jgi:hypothetical protein